MKRLLVLVAVALLLAGCTAVRPAALLDEPATATVEGCGPGSVCVTWTPVPTPTCICPTCPAAGPTPTGTPPATATPIPVAIEWDQRLNDIGVKIEVVPGARYQIASAWVTINGNWDDVPGWAKKYQLDTLGGDHNAFGTCMDANGLILPKTFILSWPTGSDGRTPEADGWANLALAGQYWNPADGPGPYTWQAVNGWKLVGLGLPHNYHWSFFVRWVEAPGYKVTDFDRAADGTKPLSVMIKQDSGSNNGRMIGIEVGGLTGTVNVYVTVP